jgi:hypothetical protein
MLRYKICPATGYRKVWTRHFREASAPPGRSCSRNVRFVTAESADANAYGCKGQSMLFRGDFWNSRSGKPRVIGSKGHVCVGASLLGSLIPSLLEPLRPSTARSRRPKGGNAGWSLIPRPAPTKICGRFIYVHAPTLRLSYEPPSAEASYGVSEPRA